MWKTKYFKTEKDAREWMEEKEHLYNMELIFINQKKPNDFAFAVEYRFLYKI